RIAELPASEPYPDFCVRRRLLQTLLFPCAEDRRHRRRDGEKPRELAAAVARRPRIFPLPARAPRARALRPAGVVLDSSCGGRSARQTRANALMTRASIFFVRRFCKMDGLPGQARQCRAVSARGSTVAVKRKYPACLNHAIASPIASR